MKRTALIIVAACAMGSAAASGVWNNNPFEWGTTTSVLRMWAQVNTNFQLVSGATSIVAASSAYATNAGWASVANTATSALTATSAGWAGAANTATSALTATSAGWAGAANTATSALTATSAGWASVANTATSALTASSAGWAATAAYASNATGGGVELSTVSNQFVLKDGNISPLSVSNYMGPGNVAMVSTLCAGSLHIGSAVTPASPIRIAEDGFSGATISRSGAPCPVMVAMPTGSEIDPSIYTVTKGYVDGTTNAAVMKTGWHITNDIILDSGFYIDPALGSYGGDQYNRVILPNGIISVMGLYSREYIYDVGPPVIIITNDCNAGYLGNWVGTSRPEDYGAFIEFGSGNEFAQGSRAIALGPSYAVGKASIAGADGAAEGQYSVAFSDGYTSTGKVSVASLTNDAVMAAYGTWAAVQSFDAGLATAFGGGLAYGYKSFAIGGPRNMAYLGMAGYFGQTVASNHYAVAMGANSQALAINSVALNGTVNTNRDTTSVGEPVSPNNAATKGYVDGATNAIASPSLVASGSRSPRDYAWYINATPTMVNDILGVGYGGLSYEYNSSGTAHAMWLLGDVKEATGMVVKIHTAVAQGSNCISGINGFYYQQTTGAWYSFSSMLPAQFTTNGATYTRTATTYSYAFPVTPNAIVHVRFNAQGLGVNATGQQTTGVVHGITWSAYK
jgi:hypothetical protein